MFHGIVVQARFVVVSRCRSRYGTFQYFIQRSQPTRESTNILYSMIKLVMGTEHGSWACRTCVDSMVEGEGAMVDEEL